MIRYSMIVASFALLGTATLVQGRSFASLMVPHHHHRHRHHRIRDPFDLVGDILRMPMYFDSLASAPMDDFQLSTQSFSSSTPQFSISTDPDTGLVELAMEVPGFKAEDMTVELENDRLLRIKGTRKYQQNGSSLEKSFDHMFQLDAEADTEKLKVSLSEGILRIQAPKKETVTKKLAIDIATEPRNMDLPAEVKNALPAENQEIVEAHDVAKEATINAEEVDGLTITTDV